MDKILILDFGGQYKQLIARRVRECNVYCEIHPYTLEIEKIKEMNPKGIILTGGPASWESVTAHSSWPIAAVPLLSLKRKIWIPAQVMPAIRKRSGRLLSANTAAQRW